MGKIKIEQIKAILSKNTKHILVIIMEKINKNWLNKNTNIM